MSYPEVDESNLTTCSFDRTEKNFHTHYGYECLDCGVLREKGLVLCVTCSQICHKGHNVRKIAGCGKIVFYCDCGAGALSKKCKCSKIEKVKKTVEKGLCSFKASKKNFVRHEMFECVSCDILRSKGLSLCKSCIEQCHEGHDRRSFGNVIFYCDCGAGGTSIECKCMKKKKKEKEGDDDSSSSSSNSSSDDEEE